MYEHHYQLKESPFRLAPDAGYFYASPAHRRALAYLRYGMARREGFIVVTGRPGTGKTTLAQALLAEARQERVVVGTLNTTHLDADDTLRMVAAAFGLPHESQAKATTLKSLEAYLSGRVRAAEHVLLVVDEAQNLPLTALEELRMLSNFQLGNHALIQIFLLGQQQFREMLNSPDLEQLRQRVVAACHLEPLSPQETRGYIEHRLRQSGWRGIPEITDLAFGMIHVITEGIPRRINAFCDRLFLYGALEGLDVLNEQAVIAVHQELSSEGVFDQVLLEPETVQPVSPLEEDDSIPPSGTALPPWGEGRKGTPSQSDAASSDDQPDDGDHDLPGKASSGGAGLRDRIHVVAGGGEVYVGGEETPPQPEHSTAPGQGVPPAVAAALEFYRNPEGQGHWLDPSTPLPEGMFELLQIAVGKDDEYSDAIWTALGSDRLEVREAARRFVREICFSQGADYFRNLGLPRTADGERIREHYRLLFRMLQPTEGEDHLQWSRRLVKAVNRAYNTLRNDERRAAYLARLRQNEAGHGTESSQEPPAWSVVPPAEAMSPGEERKAAPASDQEGKGTQGWLWGGLAVAFLLVGVGLYFTLNRPPETGHTTSSQQPLEVPSPRHQTTTPILRESGKEGPGASSSVPGPGEEKDESGDKGRLSHSRPLEAPRVHGGEASPAASTMAQSTRQSGPAKPKENVPHSRGQAPTVVNPPAQAGSESGEGGATVGKSVPPAAPPTAAEPMTGTTEKADSASLDEVEPTPGLSSPSEEPPTKAERASMEPIDPSSEAERIPIEARHGASALSLPALQALMKGFFEAYAAGDLEQFMGHFTPTAFTNDQTDLEGIRKDYAALFQATEERKMQADLAWEMLDDHRARGEGRFVVTVLPKGARSARIVTGTLVVQVVDYQGRLRINGLFHTYDRPR